MSKLGELKGNWNEKKGRIKQSIAILTDNESMLKEGKKDQKIGKLQIKLEKTKEGLNKLSRNL
jgi:uncharacterized protein YjbJ (UPF0337 family)